MNDELNNQDNGKIKTLEETILRLRQARQGYTSNETLDAFDLGFCRRLDKMRTNEPYIDRKVSAALKELDRTCDIVDHNVHYNRAYDAYNEAVAYLILKEKGLEIKSIRETTSSTPDFLVKVTACKKRDEDVKVYVEVKSLGFADGNIIYKKSQEESLANNIAMEEILKKGRNIAMTERITNPLKSHKIHQIIEEIITRIEKNIKIGQFNYDGGNNTILLVDLSQLGFPARYVECLKKAKQRYETEVSGMWWHVAFGRIRDTIFIEPEFEGENIENEILKKDGVLISHPEIKGMILGFECNPDTKSLFGFFRHKESSEPTCTLIKRASDFWNDDIDSNNSKQCGFIMNKHSSNQNL